VGPTVFASYLPKNDRQEEAQGHTSQRPYGVGSILAHDYLCLSSVARQMNRILAIVVCLVLVGCSSPQFTSYVIDRRDAAALCEALFQNRINQAMLYNEMVPLLEDWHNKHDDPNDQAFYVPDSYVPDFCRGLSGHEQY
jgi:hypothetical protein